MLPMPLPLFSIYATSPLLLAQLAQGHLEHDQGEGAPWERGTAVSLAHCHGRVAGPPGTASRMLQRLGRPSPGTWAKHAKKAQGALDRRSGCVAAQAEPAIAVGSDLGFWLPDAKAACLHACSRWPRHACVLPASVCSRVPLPQPRSELCTAEGASNAHSVPHFPPPGRARRAFSHLHPPPPHLLVPGPPSPTHSHPPCLLCAVDPALPGPPDPVLRPGPA